MRRLGMLMALVPTGLLRAIWFAGFVVLAIWTGSIVAVAFYWGSAFIVGWISARLMREEIQEALRRERRRVRCD
jgi:hypothetical protein